MRAMRRFDRRQFVVAATAGVATLALNALSFEVRRRYGMSAVWQRASGVLGIVGPHSLAVLAGDFDDDQTIPLLWGLVVLAGVEYMMLHRKEQGEAQAVVTSRVAEVDAWELDRLSQR